VEAIRDNCLRLCWWMRGSISYTEMFELDINEREMINKIVEGNLETTKKSSLPFF